MVMKNRLVFLQAAARWLWADGRPGVPGFWSHESFNPWMVAGIVLLVFLYSRGWRALARRTEQPGATLRRRAWCFTGAILTLIVALVTPVDGLADELLSMHMVQHNLLMLVAPPLLVLSYPLPALLLAFPAGVRRAIGRGWRRSGWLRGIWHALSSPLVAWLLQAGFLWAWHAPGLYQAAVANDSLHALEHFSFLASALIFWWVVLDSTGSRQKRRGLGILFLFTAALQGGLLGALLTFSPRVWYPIYTDRAARLGLSALTDQQLAGVIMWVPSGLVYLLGALWMMKSWLDALEVSTRGADEHSVSGKVAR